MTADGDGALPPQYLADTSALARFGLAPVRERIAPLLSAGLIARCGIVDLEMLFMARNHGELMAMRVDHADAFPLVPMTQADFEHIAAVTGQAMEWVVPRGSLVP